MNKEVESVFLSNVNLAYKIASGYNIEGADRDDCNQEALVALYKAIKKHDKAIAKISTYATKCIKNALIDYDIAMRRQRGWTFNRKHVGTQHIEVVEIPDSML